MVQRLLLLTIMWGAMVVAYHKLKKRPRMITELRTTFQKTSTKSDLGVGWIAPKMYDLFLVGVSHFAEFCESDE